MTTNTKWIIGAIAIIIIVLLIVLTGGNGGDRAEGPIKLGFIGPLTGDVASIGEPSLVAAQIAVDEINEEGGINGQPIQLISEDGKCTGVAAANAAQKLVNVDKVIAIIGGLCSGETLAIAPIAEAGKVPTISTCASSPEISTAGDYSFRVYPSDNYQGKFAATHIITT